MNERYCPTCEAEVTEVDGHCLLGHPLRLHAPVQSLTELRVEVDRAFEEARVRVASALGSSPPPPPPAPTSEPRRARPVLAHNLPTPPEAPRTSFPPALWEGLDEIRPADAGDPISEFAPPPRMDWGPARSKLRRARTRFEKLHPDTA
jgi:hypothetical protein